MLKNKILRKNAKNLKYGKAHKHVIIVDFSEIAIK
jgi:hypothetical protein